MIPFSRGDSWQYSPCPMTYQGGPHGWGAILPEGHTESAGQATGAQEGHWGGSQREQCIDITVYYEVKAGWAGREHYCKAASTSGIEGLLSWVSRIWHDRGIHRKYIQTHSYSIEGRLRAVGMPGVGLLVWVVYRYFTYDSRKEKDWEATMVVGC